MKKIVTTFVILFITSSSLVLAQLRDDLAHRSDYTGQIYNTDPSAGSRFSNLFNVKMSQSYSANFSSFGGQYQSLNAFTNTFQFFFNPKLTGRADVSFLHSPFGGSNSFSQNGNDLGGQILIQNAELNYQINDRASINFSFSQGPSGFGPGGYYGYNGYSRFGRSSRFNRFGGFY